MKVFQCRFCKSNIHGYNNLILHEELHRQNKQSYNGSEITSSQIPRPESKLFEEIEEMQWETSSQNTVDQLLDQIQRPTQRPEEKLFEEMQWETLPQNITDQLLDQIPRFIPVERELFKDIEEMEWKDSTCYIADNILNENGENQITYQTDTYDPWESNFNNIVDSTFHEDDSLVEFTDTEQLLMTDDSQDFLQIKDSSFHEGDSLILGIDTNQLLPPVSSQNGGGPSDYEIKLLKEKQLKKMGAVDVNYELTFKNKMFRQPRRMKDALGTLKDAFKNMIKTVKQYLQPGDIMRAAIYNDALDTPVFIPCRPMEEMDADAMLNTLVNVLNSQEDVPFDSSIRIDIGAIKYPRGGKGTKITNLDAGLINKKSIVQIKNRDNLCLLRAAVVAFASVCRKSNAEFDRSLYPGLTLTEILFLHSVCPIWLYGKIRDNDCRQQDKIIHFLSKELKINGTEPLTYGYIPKLEDYLNVNIYVISSTLGNTFSYVSQNEDSERKKIFLYHVKQNETEHFHAIVKIAGFFASSHFCASCLKPYEHSDTHRCLKHCDVCLSDDCVKQDHCVCPDCNRTCRSRSCYLRHKERSRKGNAPCHFFHKCLTCHKTFETSRLSPENHRCGYFTCKSCHQYVDHDNLCYARSEDEDPKKCDRRFIFADIEASQKTELVQCEWGFSLPTNDNCNNCRYDRILCENCSMCCNTVENALGDKTSQCLIGHTPEPRDQCSECQIKRIKCKDCQTCQNCLKSSCGKKKHTFVLAVCQTACGKCENNPLITGSTCSRCGDRCQVCSKIDKKTKTFALPPCPGKCGHRERIFRTLYNLGSWIFDERHKGFTVLFHNLSYDGQFLLQYLLSQSMRPSFIIYRGSKIQMFNVQSLHIRVIDSFNFLPMALSKLPGAFQLDSLAKGYFPHFFTSQETLNYIGHYPSIEAYGVNSMSLKDRDLFLKWHQEKVNNNEIFDFQKEILKYCRSDVDILRRACLKFKNLLFEATGKGGGQKIDAFDSCTIASLCMTVFKRKFLLENWQVLIKENDQEKTLEAVKLDGKFSVFHNGVSKTYEELEKEHGIEILKETFIKSSIACPPPNGYVFKSNFSKKSIQWLELLMKQAQSKGKFLNIRHALNGRGEYRVPGTKYSLDGYVGPDSNHPGGIAYEFNGCRFHGCPSCFKRGDDVPNPNTGITVTELLRLTRKKESILRKLGMKVVSIWECQFDEMLKSDESAQSFVKTLDIVDRLDPRDSLMGGRTNGCVLYKKATQGMKIKYVDYTSLYPFINKTQTYPVGHPEIITHNIGDISSYFGIAKIKVLPPRGLFHPVLGYRAGGKLTFPLCRSCVERLQQEPCTCNDDQRALIGTYCTPEIEKAIEKGYQILKVYEVYHWCETTQYDISTKSGGLFAQYINMFLKIKQEASGRPKWVKTDADLEKFIVMYEEREGIRLEPDNVDFNSGLRSLAKLLLNSFWGKFGQRMNLTRTEFIHDTQAHKLFEQMANPTIEIVDFNIVDDENIMLSTKKTSEDVCHPGHTNVFLASFTTCGARLKLYELLEMLQTRVLYWDTDSVIYTQNEGEPEPRLGDYLGDLTNELDTGDWITEFVCNGPKNYAYRTNQGKHVCKVKGFSLNYANSKILNMDSMKDAMFNRDDPMLGVYSTVNPNKICRDKVTSELYSQEEIKQYACVYTKRVVLSNLMTVPYGY